MVLKAQVDHLNLINCCIHQVFKSIFFPSPIFLFPAININFKDQCAYLSKFIAHSLEPWSIFQYFTFILKFESAHL